MDSQHVVGSIRDEQAAAIRSSQLVSLPANCLVALSAVLVLLGNAPDLPLLLWFVLVVTGNLVRALLAWRCQSADRVLFRSTLGSLALGVLWIAPLLLCDDVRSIPGTFLMFIVGGITAGAIVQGTSHAPTPIAFVTPLLCAVLFLAIAGGETIGYVFAANVAFYYAMLVRSAVLAEQDFCHHGRRRLEALCLADRLGRLNRQCTDAEAAMRRLATVDNLTSLLNRGEFMHSLSGLLAESAAADRTVSLILMDLDHFKSINDTLGHGAGDTVLQEVALRIGSTLPDGSLAARLGGDEFAVAIPDQDGAMIATELLLVLGEPLLIEERRLRVGASLGVAAFPGDGRSVAALMTAADLALYAAKKEGRHRFRQFDAPLHAEAARRKDLERDLPGAIEDGSIQVWFQPQVALGTGATVGAEALIRWNHPSRGWIAPPHIIEAAVAVHASKALTTHVLRQACLLWRQLAAAGLAEMVVAVNVSPREIGAYDLPACIEGVLAEHAVPAAQLEIEITEEAMLDAARAERVFGGLHAMGVRIAVDDFGAGYSSLQYLRTLKVDRIKIDRTFITGLQDHAGDRVLVQAMLGIGSALGIEVVAEGIETASDMQALRSLGCPVGQGYHFARPMAAPVLLQQIVGARPAGPLVLEAAS